MLRQRAVWYKYNLLILDLLVLNLSFVTAQMIRFSKFYQPHSYFLGNVRISVSIAVFACFSTLAIFVFHLFGLYKIQVLTSRFEHIVNLIKALLVSSIFYSFLNYITKLNYHFTDSRLVLIFWPLISLALFLLVRVVLYPFFHRFMSKAPFNMRRLLIVGDTEIAVECMNELKKNKEYGCEVVAALSLDGRQGPDDTIEGYTLEKAADIIDKFSPTDLFVAVRNTSTKTAISVISNLYPCIKNVEFTSYQYDRLADLINTDRYGSNPVFSLGESPYFFWYKFFKRTADFILSLMFILSTLPLLLIVISLIKLSSKGPGIITQPRVGKDGKIFNFYKFRTMRMAEDGEIKKRDNAYIESIANENTVVKKIVDKKRVTWIGKILRATALDETPQFFNVLKNDMSLVGPRPCLVAEYEAYNDWHKKRYSIKPGCTGIWQVLKSRGLSFSDTILLDLIYSNSVSPWLDLQLVLNTVFIMISGSADK
ncbi:exopolysaccharide biosynthesis polyprenyl glycosylphosphotransferase [candidate division WOR-3 bacterium]|nr:exopolysaccharide biosynthesis polyprenyl glycosylphosphotransferase [candidate division WOR-3 bacterium]